MAKGYILRISSFLLCSLLTFPFSAAIWFKLPASGTKCVSQEIRTNVVVLADYTVVSISMNEGHEIPKISVKVTSPYGNNVYHATKVTLGQFAFTTTESGNYLACFGIDGHHEEGASLNLDWKIGIAARDWDSVARKEKLEGVELEMRKLEDEVQTIRTNLLFLKSREVDMRIVSETTNARVAWFSIMSLGLCVGVSALQSWHLKHYFQKKKLI